MKIENLEQKLDNFIEETNVQFEAIRTGIVANNIIFERLSAKGSLISANVTEMQEEMRRDWKVLV
jgi:hypothetical protein